MQEVGLESQGETTERGKLPRPKTDMVQKSCSYQSIIG